jgi:hypothetical protein
MALSSQEKVSRKRVAPIEPHWIVVGALNVSLRCNQGSFLIPSQNGIPIVIRTRTATMEPRLIRRGSPSNLRVEKIPVSVRRSKRLPRVLFPGRSSDHNARTYAREVCTTQRLCISRFGSSGLWLRP